MALNLTGYQRQKYFQVVIHTIQVKVAKKGEYVAPIQPHCAISYNDSSYSEGHMDRINSVHIQI